MWREELDNKAKELFKNPTFGHDYAHVVRVRGRAKFIADLEDLPFDKDALYSGSTLHDVGHVYPDPSDPTFENHPDRGAKISEGILLEVGFPEEKLPLTLEIIRLHDDTKPWGKHRETDKIEVMYVQDADNIESIGHLGLIRIVQYGTKVDRPLYNSDLSFKDPTAKDKSIVHDICAHAEYIYNNLNTKTARKIAKPKVADMKYFIKKFIDEYENFRANENSKDSV